MSPEDLLNLSGKLQDLCVSLNDYVGTMRMTVVQTPSCKKRKFNESM